jgi:hypothetical protein
MNNLKKIGYGAAIVGFLTLIFAAGYFIRGGSDADCDKQDNLVHEMQERIQKDSSLMVILQQSSAECNRQAVNTIVQYEKELQSKTRTIELLKNSNFVLQDGLKELEARNRKIDSTKFNKQQLETFFNNY